MTDPRIKTLKIKTGVVKRIAKEIVMYEKEVIKERARIEKMKEEGRDEYVLRKQEEVLQESVMIIPDCQRRLHIAHAELKHILEGDIDLQELEEYKQAVQVYAEAQQVLVAV